MDIEDINFQLDKQDIIIKTLGKTIIDLRNKVNELDEFVRKEMYPKLNELSLTQ